MTLLQRDRKLIAFYRIGYSMRETASEFNISLERVRQILRRDAPALIRAMHNTCNNSTGLSSTARKSMKKAA